MDQQVFWNFLNKRLKPRGGPPCIQSFTLSDGTVLTDEEAIRSAWRDYFKDLYTAKSLKHYNDNLKAEVLHRLEAIPLAPRTDDSTILRDS